MFQSSCFIPEFCVRQQSRVGVTAPMKRVRGWPAPIQVFSFLHVVQTGSEVHPTPYPMGTGGSFSGGKAAGA
jgi:hypothetical protein